MKPSTTTYFISSQGACGGEMTIPNTTLVKQVVIDDVLSIIRKLRFSIVGSFFQI